MIALLVAAQALAVSPAPMPDISKVYRACIEQNTAKFERAHESVSETVDGLFAACRGQRALLVLSVADSKKSGNGRSMSFDQSEAFVMNVIDAELRGKAVATLFSIRSEGK